MATQIGIVKAIMGEVTATAADGSIRTLQAGDRVFANELISTGPGGAIEIEFADGSLMDLGRNSQAMLDSEVFDPNDTAVAEGAQDDVPDDVAAIQQALLEGEDPTEIGEATAAGAGVEGGNEGNNTAVFVDYLNPAVTPDAGFDTIGVNNSYDLPEEDIIVLEEEEEAPPVVPVVSVSVDVEIEIEDPQSPPPEDGVPTPEYPVLVEGNAASVLEGTSEGTKQVVFIINLSESFSEDVQVTYILQPVSANGAADNPDDWFDGVSPQTVTIPAGSTSFPVYVEIVEDNIPEANGVFEIVLISANNATINPDADSATVTIFDDDVNLVSDDVSGDETDGLVELDGVIDADFGPGDTGSISVTLTGGSWVGTATASTNTVTADDGSWTLVINNDGTYTFTQNEAFDHPDTTNPDDPLTFEFTATATDFSGNTSAPSVFTVTVDDDGPIANDDGPVAVAEDTATDITVDVNDVQGTDGVDFTDSTKVFVSSPAANGGVVYNNDGTFTYTPNAGFEGADSFEYTITDADGDTDTATVTVNVAADSKPLAVDDSATVDESDLGTGTGLNPEDAGDNFGTVAIGNLLGNDTINSGADLATITSVEGQAADGNGVITVDTAAGSLVVYTVDYDGHVAGDYVYTLQDPTADGVDDVESFDYVLTDGDTADTSTGTLTVTILDDEPVANDDGPVAVAEETATDINVAVNDVAGADGVDFTDGTKVFVSSPAANGGVVYNNDGTFTYTPNAGFEGADSFEYTITDADGDTDTATVTVNVAADSKPLAVDDSATVDESDLGTGTGLNPEDAGDNFGTVATGNLLGNDTINSGADLATITSVEGQTADGNGVITVDTAAGLLVVYTFDYDGHVAGDYVYTLQDPTADGVDDVETFDYVLTDGDSASTSTATLTVTILDDEPVANDDGPVAVAEDTATDINVAVNDVAGADGVDLTDGTKVFVSSPAANGGVVYNNDGTFTYTPNAGFEGADSFEYTITDADGDTDTATVTVNVAADSEPVITTTNAAVDETGGLDSVNGTLTIDFGNDESGSTITLSSNYDAATTNGNTLTANDGSWQLVRNANGTYTFTQLAAMDHSLIADNGSIDIEFTVDVVDGDGTPGTESFTVSVYDDGPVVTDNNVELVNEAGSLANILSYDLGEDGLGDTGSVQLSYNGPALKSGGEDVIFTSEDADGDGIFDLVGTAGGEEVIRIAQSLPDASPEDGSYSIVMSDVIDLPIINIEVPLESLAISGSTGTYSVGGEVVLTLTGNGDLKLSNAGGSDKLGVGNNNMDPGESLTFDFGGDVVNGLALDLFDNADGYQYSYEATLADGSTVNSGLITGAGSTNIDPINIPGGYTSFTITVEDDGSISQPKFKISGISYDAEDPQGLTLDFGVTATDGDGDIATGDFEVTIDPSATVNAITGTPDVISHPDTQVDAS